MGIDQEGTSKEALEEILALGIDSYIFYQAEAPIFHPKIYLFEGANNVKLIVGSSNLTARGLFTNVESSLLIEFDINDKEGTLLLSELKSYYQSLFDFSDPNLFKITTQVIGDFITRGIVPDEITRRKIYDRKVGSGNATSSQSNNVTVVSQRATARIPASFPTKPRSSGVSQTVNPIQSSNLTTPTSAPSGTTNSITTRTLIWQKLSLSQSDAQHVPTGTAITGNLKLSQARFKVNNVQIDQTTYFRNQIFSTLTWVKTKPNNNSYEEAFCPFDITLLGNALGLHTLKLSHDPVRIAGQGNTPTWLHWGNTLMNILQQTDITGRTLNLYQTNQNHFIEIV